MKLDKIPERLDPSLDLEQIRAECLELTKKTRLLFCRCCGYSSAVYGRGH